MIKKLFLPLVACFLPFQHATKAENQESDNLKMFIGTYTEGGNSEGIYIFDFNQNTGAFRAISSAKAHNPSYLVLSKDKKHLYAVSEYNDGKQGVYSFSLSEDLNKLSNSVFVENYLTSQAMTHERKPGGDPCHIRQVGQYVITANYTGGDISVMQLNEKGALKYLKQLYSFKDKKTGKASHIHCIVPSPDGKYIFATDLGLNCIYRFNIEEEATKAGKSLIDKLQMAYQGKQGMGPRHFTFHPNGRFAYLINELGGECVAFEYQDGKLQEIQTIMADEGKGHGSADIHVSPDGRFLYASHRLKKDGISIFNIDQHHGTLKKVGYQKTAKHPRNFNITPNGKFLLVASRDNNMIQIFKRDIQTGKLKKMRQSIPLSKPVCIELIKM